MLYGKIRTAILECVQCAGLETDLLASGVVQLSRKSYVPPFYHYLMAATLHTVVLRGCCAKMVKNDQKCACRWTGGSMAPPEGHVDQAVYELVLALMLFERMGSNWEPVKALVGVDARKLTEALIKVSAHGVP